MKKMAWWKKRKAAKAEKKTVDLLLAGFQTHRAERLAEINNIVTQKLSDELLVVSIVNAGYWTMLANWEASCRHNGICCQDFTFLFTTDGEVDARAKQLGFQTLLVDHAYGNIPQNPHEVFGDDTFRSVIFAKVAMTKDFCTLNRDFIRQDMDLVWNRDPREDLRRLVERDSIDMAFMYDGPSPIYAPTHFNSGFVVVRSTPWSRKAWDMIFDSTPQIFRERQEQPTINRVIQGLSQHGLKAVRLDENTYANGHLISQALDHSTPLPDNSAVMHASWTSNVALKVKHMKQFGFWYL